MRRFTHRSCGKFPRQAYAIAATGTEFDVTYAVDGNILTRYILECYDSTGNRTRTLSIIDENSVTIFTGSAHADDGDYSVPVDIELDGVYTFRITLSGAAGGTGGTDYLTLMVR